MRLQRLRIWALMLVVALAALGSWSLVLVKRSRVYYSRAFALEQRAIGWEKSASHYDKLVSLIEDSVARSRGQLRNYELQYGVNDRMRRSIEEEKEVLGHTKQQAAELHQSAAEARVNATAYRRAARYPWLGAPRVKPHSE